MQGKLIVIDGTDGSGKATQTRELVARLRKEGREVETLDFPQYTNNFFGKLLRKCLDGEYGDFIGTDPHIVTPLYAFDRFESKPKLEGWLAEGKIVVLDRYVSANQIHQGGKIEDDEKRREFLSWLDEMEHGILGLPRPDLIVYLNVAIPVTERLMANRAKLDHAEKNLAYLHRSYKQGLKMIAEMNNWVEIKCSSDEKGIFSIEEIHEKLYSVVHEHINRGEN